MTEAAFAELSSAGMDRHGWTGRGADDEFVPELRGARKFKTLKNMSENDPTINAMFFAIEMMIRQVEWWDEPAADTPADLECAEFFTSVRDDMSETWEDTISEILSMFPYGFAYCEVVYKLRAGRNPDDPTRDSKHDDNRVGVRKLPLVPHDTLLRWERDEEGSLRGFVQGTATGEQLVPIEKSLLFRTRVRNRDPEGRSLLRGAYRAWHFKKKMEEIEGIGVERDLAGLPKLVAPENMPLFDENNPAMIRIRQRAEALVTGIRRDEKDGILLPHGWDFDLVSTGGNRQLDVNKIIERWDRRILMTILADVIMVGHQGVGSYALADNKTEFLALGISAFLGMKKAVFNRYLYPKLYEMNAFPGTEAPPTLMHGDIEQRDLVALADYVSTLSELGMLTPDEGLEAFLRDAGGLPPKPDEELEEEEDPEDEGNDPPEPPDPDDPAPGDEGGGP